MQPICILNGCSNIVISKTIKWIHFLKSAGEYFIEDVVDPRASQELSGTLFHKFTLDHILEVSSEFRNEIQCQCS